MSFENAVFAVLLECMRLWAVVLMANVLATLIFAVGLYPRISSTLHRAGAAAVAMKLSTGGFRIPFMSAILAGWLIALMVWLLPVAETARVAVSSSLPTWSAWAVSPTSSPAPRWPSMRCRQGSHARGRCLAGFFLPTLLGNILGGVAFVAVLNYAQVQPDD